MGAPTVSVIVPAYNAAGTVPEAVRSVLAQTLSDVEVLVVDDGSEDDTAAVVTRVAEGDGRVRLVRQPNRGVAAARNAALAEARGVYVAPLDADDVWYPHKLAAQVARMERGGRQTGMVYSWWVGLDEAGAVRGASPRLRAEGRLASCLLYANFIGNASVPLYRREAVERVGGYDEGLRARAAQGCEDWDLSLRIAALYTTAVAPGYHVGYRRAATSMSAGVDAMARSHDAVIDRLRADWGGVPPALYRWSRGNFALYLASQSYRTGQYARCIGWAARAVRSDPLVSLSSDLWRLVAKAQAHLLGGRGLVQGVQGRRRSREARALAEVEGGSAGAPLVSPWSQAGGLYNRLRVRRWHRLREVHPVVD